MKISVSGWPGAGSSTLSLLLCQDLKIKILRGGEVFRYLGKKLNFEDTGVDRHKADKLLEEDFGHLYDKFIDFVIESDESELNNILIESDIAAFRIQNKNLFSIFLITDTEVRKERLAVDDRDLDVAELEKRDKINRNFYNELHDVDWFDTAEINQKHSLVFDNSYKTIADELREIYKEMSQQGFLNKQEALVKINEAEHTEKNFWDTGKDGVIENLKKDSLFFTSEEILSLIKKYFEKDIEKLPSELRNIILS